jgi:hypothetical protein
MPAMMQPPARNLRRFQRADRSLQYGRPVQSNQGRPCQSESDCGSRSDSRGPTQLHVEPGLKRMRGNAIQRWDRGAACYSSCRQGTRHGSVGDKLLAAGCIFNNKTFFVDSKKLINHNVSETGSALVLRCIKLGGEG